MYEWRGHFGEAAVASLTAFWASDRKYDSEQAKEDYVAHALRKALPFMYADVEENGSSVAIQRMKGSFMSNLIVQTFAIHLTDTDIVSAKNKVNDHPRSALVLTVTAIVPSLRPTDDFFSEANWGQPTMSYIPSIEKVLAHKYHELIKKARDFNRMKKGRASKAPAAEASHPNERGNIDVSSAIEADE